MSDRVAKAEQAIRRGGVTLAFDTCSVIGRSKGRLTFPLLAIATKVDALGTAREPLHLEVVVPSPVHFEVLHDLRIDLAAREEAFDLHVVERGLASKRVRVAAFDERAAVAASERLFDGYGDEQSWQRAKGDQPATLDWVVTTHADSQGWVLVTEDSGPEASKVQLRIGRKRLRALLDALCEERGAEPGWRSP